MLPTYEQFAEIAEQCEGVDFYGEYQGRFYYEGLAISADDAAAAANFLVEMRVNGFDLPTWDHQDQLGLGIIVAWRYENFKEEEVA